MEHIDKAIYFNRHISTKYPYVNTQTWDEFFEDAKGKDVILFSTDLAGGICFERFGKMVTEIVDNDPRKWNVEAKKLLPATDGTPAGELLVKEPKIICEYSQEDAVILISSVRYYEDIIDQLNTFGNYRHYVLLIMEANRRREDPQEERRDPDLLMAERFSQEPLDPKKILFYDYGTYSGHGKYITEQLLKLRTDLDIVWAVRDPVASVPEGIRLIYTWNRESYIKEAETAKIWIFDYVLPFFFIKRPEQIYINVKHWSSITLKTFGLVMEKRQERNREEQFIKNGKKMDYVIVGSEFDAESCRSGYAFDGPFLQFGSPRSDVLFRHHDCKKKLCQSLKIEEPTKLLLYAPTFRYRQKGVLSHRIQVDVNFEKLLHTLETSQGGVWKILLRLHPNVAKEAYKIPKPEGVIDVSTYPDSQELVAACDMMITDYSSIMFEPAFVRKPVFLFATDLEDYLANERDLLIDYRSLPFPIACSHEELEQNIQQFDYEVYVRGVDLFMEKYGVHEDGHASERAANFISELIGR